MVSKVKLNNRLTWTRCCTSLETFTKGIFRGKLAKESQFYERAPRNDAQVNFKRKGRISNERQLPDEEQWRAE